MSRYPNQYFSGNAHQRRKARRLCKRLGIAFRDFAVLNSKSFRRQVPK